MASTFTKNTALWRVRTDGATTNGGGFDPFTASAGTDYSDQAAPVTSGTLGTVTAASTTFVDAGAAFTAAMIGNVMQISSATGGSATAVDYYVITGYTSASTVTLDRSPATTTNITAATWAVGGAFLDLRNLALTGVGLPAPTTPSPLTIGNTVYIRGSGSLRPTVDDYDWSAGYWTFVGNNPIIVNGITTNLITVVGYNGRPRIAHCGQTINAGAGGGSTTQSGWDAKHLYLRRKLGTNLVPFITYSGNTQAVPTSMMDCIIDQNNFDAYEYFGIAGGFNYNEVFSTGATTAGTLPVISVNHPACSAIGNYINGVRGTAITNLGGASFVATTHPVIAFNTIVNCFGDGIVIDLQSGGTTLYNAVVVHNTLNNNAGNGIVVNSGVMSYLSCFNNIISNHTGVGKSAIKFIDPFQVNVQLQKHPFEANCYYNNTSDFNTISSTVAWAHSANDVLANPNYVNSAAGNYAIGSTVGGKGLSGLNGVAGTVGAATNLLNIGSYQGAAATSPLNVSFTVTEGIETVSSTANIPVAIVSNLIESADTLSTNATIIAGVAFNSVEAPETMSSASVLPVSSTFNKTESPDTLSSSESTPIAITSNLTESPETVTSSVTTVVASANITFSVTESPDSLTGTAANPVATTFTVTESPDSLTTTSALPIAVSFIATELPDTLVASENLLVTVSSNIVESPDTLSSTVFTVVSPANVSFTITESPDAMLGSVASQVSIVFSVAESADSLIASGVLPIASNFIVTESSDTITTSIVTIASPINIAFNVLESADNLVSNSTASMSVVLSTVEGSDGLSATSNLAIISGLNAVESADTLVSTLASLNSVSFSVIESPDSLTASGLTTITITGTITEGADTLVSTLATVFSSINIAANITESPDSLTSSFSTIVYVLNTGSSLFNVEDYHEFEHAPNASLDYGLDWTPWLAIGETIVSSNWTLDTPLVGSLMQVMSGVTSLFVTGGVAGKIYKVTNTVTTSLTRSDSRTLYLSCKLR